MIADNSWKVAPAIILDRMLSVFGPIANRVVLRKVRTWPPASIRESFTSA
jgi:hypothetical protein